MDAAYEELARCAGTRIDTLPGRGGTGAAALAQHRHGFSSGVVRRSFMNFVGMSPMAIMGAHTR